SNQTPSERSRWRLGVSAAVMLSGRSPSMTKTRLSAAVDCARAASAPARPASASPAAMLHIQLRMLSPRPERCRMLAVTLRRRTEEGGRSKFSDPFELDHIADYTFP